MKLFIYICIVLISARECDKNKAQLLDGVSTKTTSELLERTMQDSTKITYQAATRGFFTRIWIEGDSISFTHDNTLKTSTTYPFPQEEKEAFLKLLNDTDETALPELKAPSNAHRYDGAQMAWLEISKGETVYKTNIFDHGKPPKAIHEIVEKILSLKTMVEKQ